MGATVNPQSFDLNLLKTFVALVEERSTVKASQRLFLSQPTVSGALARLRQIFKDDLLVRNGRNLEPTSRALDLYAEIRPNLDRLTSALSELTQFNPDEDTRVFRFGCTDAVALAILPSLNAALRRQAPFCSLVVRIGDYRALPGMIASGEISTALAYLRDDPPATAKVRALRHSPWVVVRAADEPAIKDLDDFCARAHALVTPLGDLAGFVDGELAKVGRSRRVVLGISAFSLLLSVLPGSDLVATVPDFVAEWLVSVSPVAVDPCPIAVPLVINTLAWRAVADRDPAEQWFRERVMEAFRTPS